MNRTIMRALACGVLLAAPLAGCTSNSATSGMAAATAQAGGLYTALGGSAGVTALANSFGARLKVHPAVTKFLDTAAIDGVQAGLINSLSVLGGVTPPAGSTDLLTALSGKGLDKAAVDGVNQSLVAAAQENNVGSAQIAGLQAFMKPISDALLR